MQAERKDVVDQGCVRPDTESLATISACCLFSVGLSDSSPATTLLDLPEELLDQCFCHLSFTDARTSLYTCKRVSRIVEGLPLHHRVMLSSDTSLCTFKAHLLRKSAYQTMVKALRFDFRDMETTQDYSTLTAMTTLLALLPNLRSLALSLSPPDRSGQEQLFSTILRYNRRLLHLSLEEQWHEHYWNVKTLLNLSDLPLLKSLSITHFFSFGELPLQSFASNAFANLQELDLKDHEFEDGELEALLQSLPSTMASLRLHECVCLPLNLTTIISRRCPRLKTLYLLHNTSPEASGQHDPAWAKSMSALSCIAITHAMAAASELYYLHRPLRRVVLSGGYINYQSGDLARLLYSWVVASEGLHVSLCVRWQPYTNQEQQTLMVRVP